MSTLTDNVYFKALGASAAVVAGLALKYPDRALFDEQRNDIAHKKGWPLLGALPALLANKEKMHEFMLSGFTVLDSLTTYV